MVDALPLTPQTGHVFDAAAFGAMRPTARFMNVGRGETVDEAALIDALASGGSRARRSTCSRRSRFPPTARCGRWRT